MVVHSIRRAVKLMRYRTRSYGGVGAFAPGACALGAAHLVLSVSSLISLVSLKASTASATFGSLLLYGIAGFLTYAIPDMHYNMFMVKFLTFAQILTRNLAVPCVVTYLYSMSGFPMEIVYMHLIAGVTPVGLFMLKLGVSPLIDLSIAFNIVSLFYISYLLGNTWGIGLGVCHILNHFLLNGIKDSLEEAPVDCLFVVGMNFLNIFALKTFKDCEI